MTWYIGFEITIIVNFTALFDSLTVHGNRTRNRNISKPVVRPTSWIVCQWYQSQMFWLTTVYQLVMIYQLMTVWCSGDNLMYREIGIEDLQQNKITTPRTHSQKLHHMSHISTKLAVARLLFDKSVILVRNLKFKPKASFQKLHFRENNRTGIKSHWVNKKRIWAFVFLWLKLIWKNKRLHFISPRQFPWYK